MFVLLTLTFSLSFSTARIISIVYVCYDCTSKWISDWVWQWQQRVSFNCFFFLFFISLCLLFPFCYLCPDFNWSIKWLKRLFQFLLFIIMFIWFFFSFYHISHKFCITECQLTDDRYFLEHKKRNSNVFQERMAIIMAKKWC